MPSETAKRIKELRNVLALSQAEFGKKIGILASSVSRIESGVNSPSAKTINRICQEFDVRREWLTEGKGPIFMEKTEDVVIINTLFESIDSPKKRLVIEAAALDNDSSAIMALEFIRFAKRPEIAAAADFIIQWSKNMPSLTIMAKGNLADETAENVCDIVSDAFSAHMKEALAASQKEN